MIVVLGMSSSNRRRDESPSRSSVGSSKLRMDRQPIVTRISGEWNIFFVAFFSSNEINKNIIHFI